MIKCINCGRINEDLNTYCENCRELLYTQCPSCKGKVFSGSSICSSCLANLDNTSKNTLKEQGTPQGTKNKPVAAPLQTAFCPKCGAANEPGNTYCERCRSRLGGGPSGSHAPGLPKYRGLRFRIPAFVIAVTGASLGAVSFSVLLLLTIYQIRSEIIFKNAMLELFDFPVSYNLSYILQDFGASIVALILCLVAFILGFVGSSKVLHDETSGRYPLIVGAVLDMLCAFAGFWFVSAVGAVILTAGIFAFFEKESL